ncbi:uncharacterized protein LOC121378739 [Gigantopelta aegis]|uniref:uncharacterized protein LOC121378739 n=1 Tax=Gigantopelta aegis TaxID=1735272 RepID=UPI001B887440|nr:uncharacterized protein LOC121378739 [Gigantopelta aegis]
MNAMLALVILVGLVSSVNCACDIAASKKCVVANVDMSQSKDAFADKFCQKSKTFLKCMEAAGCDNTEVNTAKELRKLYACGGSMVTASVLTIFLTLFTMLFK